jgi:hypothetical protein
VATSITADAQFAPDSSPEEGVMSELVSVGKFPATSEFAGNFARFGYSVTLQLPEKVSDRRCLRGQFPKHPSREFLRLSREFNRYQGMLQRDQGSALSVNNLGVLRLFLFHLIK